MRESVTVAVEGQVDDFLSSRKAERRAGFPAFVARNRATDLSLPASSLAAK